MQHCASFSSGLTATRFGAERNPPASASTHVQRTALHDLLRKSHAVKLVLVRGPAGFGKTTTLTQFRAEMTTRGTSTAWMTVEGADNDPLRFLNRLLEAIRGMGSDIAVAGDELAPLLNLSAGDIALKIIDHLAALDAPFALFLDEFEALKNPAILGLLREILAHLPHRGQLLIGSRALPDLGLGRLRARGQVLEIDTDLLRFSLEETAEFLNTRRTLGLTEDDLLQLHRKTEGWIAAIGLAAVALARRDKRSDFISNFSGSHEAIATYLADDVLAQQPAYIRDFLLHTSILRHVNAPLCSVILPGVDAASILNQLLDANLFLAPIEGDEKTYRYHKLFASYLRTQFVQEKPVEMLRLHRAVSQWHEAQGRPIPAIDHALDGAHFEHALRLLSRHAEDLLAQGRMRLLTRWLNAMPQAHLRSTEMLQVVHVWALCFTNGPHQAMALLDDYGCARSQDPDVIAHVLALRPALLAMMDRNEEAYAVAQETLPRLPTTKPFAASALANEMAYVCAIMGRYDDAHHLLESARRNQGTKVSLFNRMYSESIEGMIDLERGRLRQATARFRIAVNSTHVISCSYTHGNAYAGVFYAAALYEANDLRQAELLLHVYVPAARDAGLPDQMIIGYVLLSRIAFCRGDIDQVFHLLAELEYLGHQRQLPRVVASAKLERARVLAMQGNQDAAKEALLQADDTEVWMRINHQRLPAHDLDYLELGRIRWHVLFSDARKVLPCLENEIAMAMDAKRHRRMLKLQVLQAIAYWRAGERHNAATLFHKIAAHCCQEGLMRLIADEGQFAGAIALRLAEPVPGGAERDDPILADFIQRLIRACGVDPDRAKETTTSAGKIPQEPLTPKEIRMLVLLADGYSNNTLSEKLFISDSTVRTHLRNINAKLHAASRSQAVAIARRMGVIR